ncbi:hypothetical protein ACYF6T_08145 [Streptomyces sp. 7R007]
MSGVGPVEPGGTGGVGGGGDVIGSDAPRLADRLGRRRRWVPRRVRRALLAALVVGAVAVGVLLLPTAGAPDRAEPPEPLPYPANVTRWGYLGLAEPIGAHDTSGLFRFAVSIDYGPPVTVRATGTDLGGLAVRSTPDPAFTVHAGATRRITVKISVSDCSGLPIDEDLPFLVVTLRNTRAIQQHTFIFGGRYARDLSRLLRTACGAAPATLPSRPSGSAGSQNAD